jgi:CO dehydrogenase maturation factor
VVKELEQFKITPIITIPFDVAVLEYDLEKRSLLDLPDTSKAAMAVKDLMEIILNKK